MLNQDLTVVDNHASLTLPGVRGSIVYAGVATPKANKTLRREAATANTTPYELEISHELVGGTGFKARIRTLVRINWKKLDQDTSLTGGVVPSASTYWVLDRPVQSGGAVTTALLKNLVGALLDVILTSGQLDKLLNQEG